MNDPVINLYHPGQKVRIDHRQEPRHHRVPHYAMGKVGVITELCSTAALPEEISETNLCGSRVPVYRVRINQRDLWNDYGSYPNDTLEIEIYQHWLELVTEQ